MFMDRFLPSIIICTRVNALSLSLFLFVGVLQEGESAVLGSAA